MNKVDLRREFLTRRKTLSLDEVNHRSQAIAQLFLDFLTQNGLAFNPLLIHTFLPIQKQHEVDTWLIINSIWQQFPQLKFTVSVTDITSNQLTHYPLYADTRLQKNRWDIPEPIDATQQSAIDNQLIDLVLVPLLVFDKRGHRVGYGGGYYDRFLADCRPDCLTMGLSLFDPVEQIDDIELTDIRLDACLTPKQLFSFN
ncbi:5-formyltetrahydrofolate cyclo-ligase [Spirosoma sp. HMF4905]|uniref:5-formyltetrahydrofolate cyclo-ligase n=1 Tax=Spirosoma arboris TaxID=2682092 RepID=A0A7K1SI15_9BACT|nr:5-formyltetrahydrofolate cyclo-ligase [Spirosoma arboris]MVM33226.1 5-formyltetrahydrofolate cyclo-ligase [Spirosoma arboris]